MICFHRQGFEGWFFGGNNHVQFGDVHSFDHDDPFSISCWITVQPGEGGNVVTKYVNDDAGANTRRGWGFQMPLSGIVRFYLGNNLGTNIQLRVDTAVSINDGVEHHVAIAYNGNHLASGVTVRIDGVLASVSGTETLGTATTLSSAIMQIGGNDGVGSFGPGQIRDVALYDIALNSTQMGELYNGGTPPTDLYSLATTPDPLMWVKMNDLDTDEPDGVIDYGTGGNNGTANFSPYELIEDCTDFPIEESGYTSDFGTDIVEIPLAGGPSRRMQDVVSAGHIVNVSWLLTPEDYTQFMGFFRTNLSHGRDTFLIDLITDIGIETKHRARTIGGMPKLTRQSGDGYWVTCTLQCDKNPTYTGAIAYTEDGRIVFATDNPTLTEFFAAGDVLRIIDSEGIHPTGSTPLNLDGEYEVDTTTGFNSITLVDPASVNSDWTVLAALGSDMVYGDEDNGNVISTVTKVPQE